MDYNTPLAIYTNVMFPRALTHLSVAQKSPQFVTKPRGKGVSGWGGWFEMHFKLYVYLLENVSWLSRNSVQFANLLSLLVSPVVSECTNQIKMGPEVERKHWHALNEQQIQFIPVTVSVGVLY
jgi:hypothetical protein